MENKEKQISVQGLDLQLAGKRALVTGSTSGIGEGIAKMLAKHGAQVIVHGRNQQRGQTVVEHINGQGGMAHLVLGDLRYDDQAQRVAQEAVRIMGAVDILVNNAGEFAAIKFDDTTPQDWQDLYNNNLVSQVRMVQALAPQMKKLGWGRIINISSRGATMSGAIAGHYSATKSGNISLTLTLQDALKNTGITVNTISPGEVDTPAARRFFATVTGLPVEGTTWEQIEEAGIRQGKWVMNSVGRYGKVEDIAPLVAYLASPVSNWISGQNFHIDGGSTKNFY